LDRGSVGPRDGLDDVEKWIFFSYRDSNSDRSVVQLVTSLRPPVIWVLPFSDI
jgi:hypothetical protein